MKWLLAVCLTVAGLMPVAARADGPGQNQPATSALTRVEAHRTAQRALDDFLRTIPRPREGHVGKCSRGPYVWICPASARGGDVRCRVNVEVWADRTTYFFELQRLRCQAP